MNQRMQTDAIMSLRGLSAMMPNPFPVVKRVEHPFVNFGQITTTASFNVATATYGLNALYDPQQAGTGDYQPYGYNTLALLYGRYLVKSAYLDIEFFDPSVDGMTVGFKIGGSDPSGLAINVAQQQPFTAIQTLSNTGDQRASFQIPVPIHSVLGLSQRQYEDELGTYGAVVGSNPSKIVNVRLFAAGVGSGTPTVRVNVRIVYKAQWYDRTTLAASQVA